MNGFVRCITNDYNNNNFTIGKDYHVSGKSIETNWSMYLELDVIPEDVLDSTFKFALCKFKRV